MAPKGRAVSARKIIQSKYRTAFCFLSHSVLCIIVLRRAVVTVLTEKNAFLYKTQNTFLAYVSCKTRLFVRWLGSSFAMPLRSVVLYTLTPRTRFHFLHKIRPLKAPPSATVPPRRVAIAPTPHVFFQPAVNNRAVNRLESTASYYRIPLCLER